MSATVAALCSHPIDGQCCAEFPQSLTDAHQTVDRCAHAVMMVSPRRISHGRHLALEANCGSSPNEKPCRVKVTGSPTAWCPFVPSFSATAAHCTELLIYRVMQSLHKQLATCQQSGQQDGELIETFAMASRLSLHAGLAVSPLIKDWAQVSSSPA